MSDEQEEAWWEQEMHKEDEASEREQASELAASAGYADLLELHEIVAKGRARGATLNCGGVSYKVELHLSTDEYNRLLKIMASKYEGQHIDQAHRQPPDETAGA